MPKFFPGERVVFVDPFGHYKGNNSHTQIPGEMGTIADRPTTFGGNWWVDWDSGKHDPGYHESYLQQADCKEYMPDTRDYLEAIHAKN